MKRLRILEDLVDLRSCNATLLYDIKMNLPEYLLLDLTNLKEIIDKILREIKKWKKYIVIVVIPLFLK